MANIITRKRSFAETDIHHQPLNSITDVGKEHEYLSSFPAGVRFHPTDQELVGYYLRKKLSRDALPPNPIREANVYQFPPQQLTDNFNIWKTGKEEWYFFTPRSRKYKNGDRPKRSVGDDGYWRASGAPIKIKHSQSGQQLGRKTGLVYYIGKPKNDVKTNWMMQEYTIKGKNNPCRDRLNNQNMKLNDWVLVRIYHKIEKKTKKGSDKPKPDGVVGAQESNENGDEIMKGGSLTDLGESHQNNAIVPVTEVGYYSNHIESHPEDPEYLPMMEVDYYNNHIELSKDHNHSDSHPEYLEDIHQQNVDATGHNIQSQLVNGDATHAGHVYDKMDAPWTLDTVNNQPEEDQVDHDWLQISVDELFDIDFLESVFGCLDSTQQDLNTGQ